MSNLGDLRRGEMPGAGGHVPDLDWRPGCRRPLHARSCRISGVWRAQLADFGLAGLLT
jgi:hypothetical protein